MKKYRWLVVVLSMTVLAHACLTIVNVSSTRAGSEPDEEIISDDGIPLAPLNELGSVSLAGQLRILDELIPESSFPSTGVVLNVLDFGAVGDGKVDDTEAFQEAIETASPYDTVYAPKTEGEYVLTDTLEINRNIHFIIDGGIAYKGVKDRPVISTNNLLKCRFSVVYIRDGDGTLVSGEPWGGYHGYENDQYTGVMMSNSKWTSVSIGLVANFTNGVVCRAVTPGGNGNGFWFNNVNVTAIKDCLNGLELRNDAKGSWVNSNVFYNTSFTVGGEAGFRSNGHTYVSVLQSCVNGNTNGANTNLFYNLRFEVKATSEDTALTNGTTYTAIYLHRAACWSFINYRTEFVGPDINFCVIDFEGLSGLTSKSGMTWGLTLIPINAFDPMEIAESERVRIINVVNPPCPIDEIYQYPSTKWYTMEQDQALRSKALRLQNNTFTLQGYSFVAFSKNGGEIPTSPLTQKTLSVDTELSIESSGMFALTLTPANEHSTVLVNLAGSKPSFALFCYREDGSLFTTGYDSKGVRLLAMDGYFDKNIKAFFKNSASSRSAFSVLSDEVKYVTVGIYGLLSGYSLVCNDPDVQVLRYRENLYLNNFSEYFSFQAPTGVDAPVDSCVFDANETNRFWQLTEEAGKKKWIYK